MRSRSSVAALSFVLTYILGFISTLLSVFIIRLIGAFLLPSLLGLLSGFNYIAEIKTNDVCVPLKNKTISKGDIITQCPQLIIRGHKLAGKIILENSVGYYIHVNNGFIYTFKDKEGCIYSKFEVIKHPEDTFTGFTEKQIDSFCNVESHINKVKKLGQPGLTSKEERDIKKLGPARKTQPAFFI